MINLYPYQNAALESIRAAFRNKQNWVFVASPTGSGKTVMFCEITRLVFSKEKSILIVTDRKNLNSQSGNTLQKFGITPVLLTADSKSIPTHNVVVAMLETLKRRMTKPDYVEFIRSFDLIIFDEAHKSSFDRLFEVILQEQRVLGFSATPLRTGNQDSLDKYYTKLIEVIKVSELFELGKLSRPKWFVVKQDLSKIHIKKGDYDNNELTEFYDNKTLYDGALKNYQLKAPGTKFIIFCNSIENSKKMKDTFCESGIPTVHIDANTPEDERDEIYKKYHTGEILGLCNVDVCATGFDEPTIETVILYMATKSLISFLQKLGRGTRATKTKKEFNVFDFGNNFYEHEGWDLDKVWSLQKPPKKPKTKEDVSPVKECPNPDCGALIPAQASVCQYCGYVYPQKEKKRVEVLLEELSRADLERLCKGALNGYEKPTIHELIDIQETKKFNPFWVVHFLNTREEVIEFGKIKGYSGGWAYRVCCQKGLQ